MWIARPRPQRYYVVAPSGACTVFKPGPGCAFFVYLDVHHAHSEPDLVINRASERCQVVGVPFFKSRFASIHLGSGALPQEILEQILGDVYYPNYTSLYQGRLWLFTNYKTLLSCCLVCTAWRDPAQKLLFHALRFRYSSDIPSDSARYPLFFSPRATLLASYVRRLDIFLSHKDGKCSPQDLANIVACCHQIYDVTLRVDGIHELSAEVLQCLRRGHAASFPHPIRSLSLLVCSVQSPILFQLLAVWTTVQFLRVGVELAARLPAKPSNLHLYELALHRIPPLRVAEWLLASSHDTLRILDCHTAPSAEYDPLIRTIGRDLISLRIFRHTIRTAALIQHCPALRELAVIQLSSFLPLGELPPTLEHLGFRSLSTIPMGVVFSAIEKLPKLRLFSCEEPTVENTEFPLLQKKCQEKGVVFLTQLLPVLTVSVLAHMD